MNLVNAEERNKQLKSVSGAFWLYSDGSDMVLLINCEYRVFIALCHLKGEGSE